MSILGSRSPPDPQGKGTGSLAPEDRSTGHPGYCHHTHHVIEGAAVTSAGHHHSLGLQACFLSPLHAWGP